MKFDFLVNIPLKAPENDNHYGNLFNATQI